MKISVFGLGYVGAVTAACLSRDGHTVIGVDVSDTKINLINQGRSPVVEPGLTELISEGVRLNRIFATSDAERAILDTEVSLISVGTPPTEAGEPDLGYVWGVCRTIAESIEKKESTHVVVLRSTVPPGTLRKCISIFEELGVGSRTELVFNPEFLRESSAIRDYDSPPYTVVGTESYLAEQALRKIYEDIKAPIIVVEPEVAEMVKYVANAWHAAKVTFANEVGRISKSFGVDGRSVMDIIVQDKKLNISKAYMKPGFAFGGSCLPKDLSSLIYYAKQNSVSVPFIDSMPTANQAHIRSVAKEILALGSRKIAFLGLAFKPNTDDLRESPNVILIKYLIGEGCSIKIYDPSVHEARLMGTNLAYIRENIPHFENLLMPSLDSALLDCDLIVVSHSTQLFRDVLENISIDSKIKIFDLAGIFDHPLLGVDYYGIAW